MLRSHLPFRPSFPFPPAHIPLPASHPPPPPRDEGIFRFVRYVSASAPSSRWDVSAEYEIELPLNESDEGEPESEEEDEEGAEEPGAAGPA